MGIFSSTVCYSGSFAMLCFRYRGKYCTLIASDARNVNLNLGADISCLWRCLNRLNKSLGSLREILNRWKSGKLGNFLFFDFC